MTLSDEDGESDSGSLAFHEAEWAQREAFDEVFRYAELEDSIAQREKELGSVVIEHDAYYKRESRKLRDANNEHDKVVSTPIGGEFKTVYERRAKAREMLLDISKKRFEFDKMDQEFKRVRTERCFYLLEAQYELEKLDNQYDAEEAGYPLGPMEAVLKALQRRQDVKRAHDAANGDTIPAKRAKGELESSSGRPDASVPNDMPHTA